MKKYFLLLFLLIQLGLDAVSTRDGQSDNQEIRAEDGLVSAFGGLGIQNSVFPTKRVRFPDELITATEYTYVQDRGKATSNTVTQIDQIIDIFEDWLVDVKAHGPIGSPGFERKELLVLLLHVQDALYSGTSVSFTKAFNSLFSLMKEVQVSKSIENYNRLLTQTPVDEKALQLDIDKIEDSLPQFITRLGHLKELFIAS